MAFQGCPVTAAVWLLCVVMAWLFVVMVRYLWLLLWLFVVICGYRALIPWLLLWLFVVICGYRALIPWLYPRITAVTYFHNTCYSITPSLLRRSGPPRVTPRARPTHRTRHAIHRRDAPSLTHSAIRPLIPTSTTPAHRRRTSHGNIIRTPISCPFHVVLASLT